MRGRAMKTQRKWRMKELSVEDGDGSSLTHLLTGVVNNGLQICTVQNRHLQHSSHIW